MEASVSTLQPTLISKLRVLMVGIANNDWAGTSSNVVIKAGTAAPYPDPTFSFFPSKISANDILTLTRQYNERTAGTLKIHYLYRFANHSRHYGRHKR